MPGGACRRAVDLHQGRVKYRAAARDRKDAMKPNQMRKLRSSAKHACGLLSVLANEDRLLLLCQIAHHEHSVGELEELLDIRQPTLSQQLGVLRQAGLVDTRREGKRIFYRLKSREALAVIDAVYEQYCA